MRIREFSSRADGLAKRPREVFTSKQRLMHGSEISREVRQVTEIHSENVAKPAEKKKRRSFKDAIKMLAGGAAAAAVVAVSATAAAPAKVQQPEAPPALPNYTSDEKYSYSVYFPTYRETLEPGGYAVVLDLSTDEKKQALYKCFADSIFEILRLEEEMGDEYRNDPEPYKTVWVSWCSETENGGNVSGMGRASLEIDDTYIRILVSITPGAVLGYYNSNPEIMNYMDTSTNISMQSVFSSQLLPSLGIDDFTAMKRVYGGRTSEEILELITDPLDKYLFEVNQAADGAEWKNIYYETESTLEQFTITQGKADIVMPEFFKVIQDDELYGWKTLTVPESGDYILITGSDEYPADKPYGRRFETYQLDRLNITKYLSVLPTKEFPTTAPVNSNWAYFIFNSGDGEIALSDIIYSHNFDEPQTGSNHIYYDLVTLNVAEGTEMLVPQLSRLLPIEDKYYQYRLGGTSTYTITNNGDHEVVVIGNLQDHISEQRVGMTESVNYRYNNGALGQFFNCEPLLPGESLTIYSIPYFEDESSLASTLIMPECCTVIDSSGHSYSHDGFEVDLIS